MKKGIVLFALVFGFMTVQAQEKNEKNTYIENGNLVAVTLHFDSGEISQTGFYTKEGNPTGQWLSYNRQGDKTAKAQYDNGQKVGTWFFWTADKLTEVDYSDSKVASVNVWNNKADSEVVINK